MEEPGRPFFAWTACMSHELICSWLGLPAGSWPPDHYRLLDLEPGESNPEQIEEQVHERLEAVRRYQLLHPEEVTEAMNRLAQAFVCLTDPAAKKAYDERLLGKAAAAAREPVAAGVAAEEAQDPLAFLFPPPAAPALAPGVQEMDWATTPPPQRGPAGADTLSARPPEPGVPGVEAAAPPRNGTAAADATQPLPPVAAAEAPADADPAETAALSAPARRGLGTKRGLYQRVARTRQLLRAWEAAGKYLGQPKRRLAKPAEATELIRLLTAIRTLLPGFPPILGEAGQPGYAVVALARQPTPVPTFQTLLPSQRETLSQHWKAGHKLLASHRDYLRRELRALRRTGPLGRAFRAVRAELTDQPYALLLLLALLAINIAVWRSYVPHLHLPRWTNPPANNGSSGPPNH